jgi:hypothetical protein
MKKLLFCIFLLSFIWGCQRTENISYSGILVTKNGSKIFFRNMQPKFYLDDVTFKSEGNSLEFSIRDIKELYLSLDENKDKDEKEVTQEKYIITKKSINKENKGIIND